MKKHSQLEDVIKTIKERLDLFEFVRQDGLDLEAVGAGNRATSPFISESVPSLVVWPGSRVWLDFSGCEHRGGDCVDYVMRRHGISFLEAVERLARFVGVEFSPSRRGSRRNPRSQQGASV